MKTIAAIVLLIVVAGCATTEPPEEVYVTCDAMLNTLNYLTSNYVGDRILTRDLVSNGDYLLHFHAEIIVCPHCQGKGYTTKIVTVEVHKTKRRKYGGR